MATALTTRASRFVHAGARFADATARCLQGTFPDAHAGEPGATSDGYDWQVVVPAARGQYVATVTVVDPRVVLDEGEAPDAEYEHRGVSLKLTGSWSGTTTTFEVPGGFSAIPDIGDPVQVDPRMLAQSIVRLITEFESKSPALSLGVAADPAV
ncbi:MAG: hypothetical protein L0H93_10440 [Nocardioides sp.]|nr:hypothetical protein [Nocardioides sp.]